MWYVFIQFGGILFWGLTVLATVALLALVSREKLAASFGVLALFVAIMTGFSSVKVAPFVLGSWPSILCWIGIYLAAGIVWATARWILFALKCRRFFYEHKDAWRETRLAAGFPLPKDMLGWDSGSKGEFLMHFADAWNGNLTKWSTDGYSNNISIGSYRNRYDGERMRVSTEDANELSTMVFNAVMPKARNNKSRISVWLSFWPLSILCYFLEDFVVDVCRFIVRQVVKLFNAINAAIFAGMKKDLGVR